MKNEWWSEFCVIYLAIDARSSQLAIVAIRASRPASRERGPDPSIHPSEGRSAMRQREILIGVGAWVIAAAAS